VIAEGPVADGSDPQAEEDSRNSEADAEAEAEVPRNADLPAAGGGGPLVGGGALIGILSGRGPFPFRLAWEGEAVLAGLAATVPLVVLAFLLTKGPLGRLAAFERIHLRVKAVLEVPLRGIGPWGIALISAAAGIGEEVLFRGVLQDLLGLVATSLVFGLLHALTPTYFALATALGAYLGWLQAYTGNLLAPIIVHALYDLVALGLIKQRFAEEAGGLGAPRNDEPSPPDTPRILPEGPFPSGNSGVSETPQKG
jgi:membrane protease YdiL (CAAX protease family)